MPISSKHLIQVHLEILRCSVEKMASHSLTKYITWRKSCQFLRSLKSWNLCTCTSCTWLPFHIGQVCSQAWCRPYLAANFGFFELRTFPWSPSTVGVGTLYDSQRMSRTTEHISKAGKVDPGDRLTLPVKFACKPELTLTRLLGKPSLLVSRPLVQNLLAFSCNDYTFIISADILTRMKFISW